jgi:hypothetical protein
MLRVWIKATNASDDAILILKLTGHKYRWWWPDAFTCALKAIEKKIGKTRKEAAPVFFYNQVLPDWRMPDLYAATTHYWSMSYGEGWDLPMMEAAATGLYLIAPKHSAYTAYLDEAVAQLIPSRRIPAEFNHGIGLGRLFQGSDWWEPEKKSQLAYVKPSGRLVRGRRPRDHGFPAILLGNNQPGVSSKYSKNCMSDVAKSFKSLRLAPLTVPAGNV